MNGKAILKVESFDDSYEVSISCEFDPDLSLTSETRPVAHNLILICAKAAQLACEGKSLYLEDGTRII